MHVKTRILSTVAVGVVAAGAFTVGAAADDTTGSDVRQARQDMHAQMGGDMAPGMMSGESWESMQAMHEAIDPAAMQEMHDAMVQQLPPELRDDAERMHAEMFPAMAGSDGFDHESHHRAGS